MVNPSWAAMVLGNTSWASLRRGFMSVYRAEKWPIINCFAWQFLAIMAAWRAVEWKVNLAISSSSVPKVDS